MSSSKICHVHVKIKNCCSAEGTVRKMERQATDWEETCAKELYPKYKKTIHLKAGPNNNVIPSSPIEQPPKGCWGSADALCHYAFVHTHHLVNTKHEP